MRAEILSIGTELLIGSILNTNAQYLSRKLAENALDVYYQTTVGDNPSRLIDALTDAFDRSDLVITSGGLGPTLDDITMASIASFLNKPLVFHRPTFRRMQERIRRAHLRSNAMARRQCFVPKGCCVFPNAQGTAPGVLAAFQRKGKNKFLIVLPGPPRELEPMFEAHALPEFFKLARIKREHFVIVTIKITGLSEVQVAKKVPALLASKPPLTVGIYAKSGGLVELRIMAKSRQKKLAQQLARRAEKTIRARLNHFVFGINDDTLSTAAGRLLRSADQTLATAESCTGGFLSGLLTDTPGSSRYFLGGVIAYNNAVKVRDLGVRESTLKQFGAVSPQTAAEMASGAQRKFQSAYALSLTGIAGPDGGSAKKPVGLVYIGLAGPYKTRVWKFFFRGNRREIKSRASHKALDLLRLELLTAGRPRKP